MSFSRRTSLKRFRIAVEEDRFSRLIDEYSYKYLVYDTIKASMTRNSIEEVRINTVRTKFQGEDMLITLI